MSVMNKARELRAKLPEESWFQLDHACALAIAIGVEMDYSDIQLSSLLLDSYRPEANSLVAYCRDIARGQRAIQVEFGPSYEAIKNLIQPVCPSQIALPTVRAESES